MRGLVGWWVGCWMGLELGGGLDRIGRLQVWDGGMGVW